MSTVIPCDSPSAQALAWTLVHFIWQGAAIGVAAFLMLRVARLTAEMRYAVGAAVLAVMLAAPVVTFVILKQEKARAVQIVRDPQTFGRPDSRIAANAQNSAASDDRSLVNAGPSATFDLRRLTPSLIVVFWFAGVLALSARLLGGWLVAQRLVTRAVQPVAPEICALARCVADRLPLDRMVRLFESAAVAVPVTIGWLKPVVLLPAAAMTGLSTAQIEALVAHELAHVRRHDYLVNLLQSAVETLLFYHPAVWWASRLVRTEREHCCDDAAINLCDRLVYVTALSELAALGTPRVVMAASGGSLLRRVRRILGGAPGADQSGAGWLPAFVLILFAGAFVPAALTSAPAAIQELRPAGVQSGVAGGVIGGEPAGVVGGTAGGRTEAIAGGIAGGTLAGIKGGVTGGIVGGIVGAPRGSSKSAGPASQSSQRQAVEARRTELEHEKEKQLRVLQAHLGEIEPQRQEPERRSEAVQQEAEIAKLEIALKQTREQYERTKRLVEVGMVTPQTLTEVEVGLRLIEQKIAAAREGGQFRELKRKIADLTAQLELARQRLERANRLSAAGLAVASAVKEAEAELTSLELKLAAVRKQLQLQETDAELQRRQAARQAELAKIERALQEIGTSAQAGLRGAEGQQAGSSGAARAGTEVLSGAATASERNQRLLSSSAPVPDTKETVRVGDLLVIEIAGEPDLPLVYTVADDGAIRLPLIGKVPVRDLTTVQVREAVMRELAKRKLAGGLSVTVGLRRIR